VPVELVRPPLLGVVPEGDPTRSRVDPLAHREVDSHLGQEVLGVDLPAERSRALSPGWISVGRLPTLAASEYVSHG
jgi:hypothetical protein